MLPFDFFRAYGIGLISEMNNRSKQLKRWIGKGRHAIPRAKMNFHTQLKAADEYSAVFIYDGIAYVAHVTHPLKQRRVNAETPYTRV